MKWNYLAPRFKNSLDFGKSNFSALRLKKFLYFLKKAFLVFQEAELFLKNFPCLKNKKTPLWKKFLYFGKLNFLFLTFFILIKLYTLNKSPLGETGCLSNLYYLLAAQSSNFFIYPPFPNTVSQDTFGNLLPTLQYLCDSRDAMPRHWSPPNLF